jgi:hypothetical protein
LNHRQPDRVPIDIGASAVTGMHVSCVAALRRRYGLERRPVKVHEPFQMLGWVDEDLKQAVGIDVEGVFPRTTMFGFANEGWKTWRLPDGLEVLVPEGFRTTETENGDTLLYPQGDTTAPPSGKMPRGGYFFDIIVRQPPLDETTLRPEDNLEEYVSISAEDLEHFRQAARAAAATGRAVLATIGGASFGDIGLVPAPFLKHPRGIRDITEWYIATSTRRDYLHRVFSAQCDVALANLAVIDEAVGDILDVVYFDGADFGTQTSTFCSAETFRELYSPYHARVNEWVHAHTNWKIMKHCCGAMEKLIPPLIDSGFDALNPVQCSAAGMDPMHLKSTYGDRLTFWGGGADTQTVLQFGTPERVRKQVLERCRVFSGNGGFVFSAVHNILPNTPVSNIIALIKGIHEFNGGGSHA